MAIRDPQPWLEEEQAERDREVVESFTQDRLKSYYVNHPEVAQRALRALAKAKDFLIAGEPQVAVVMAGVAIEVGYKTALLRPVVSSLVHNDAMAGMVMELATSHTGLERFSAILQAILVEFAGVDLKTFVRTGGKEALWAEMKKVSDQRRAGASTDNRRKEGHARNTAGWGGVAAVGEHLYASVHQGVSQIRS